MSNPMVFNIITLERNALSGDGLSCYLLGRSYFSEENGVTCDYNKSVFWYKRGHEKLEDPRCTYGLAICYEDGVGGLEKDLEKSNLLFTQALVGIIALIKNGDPFSMFILGAYYFYGLAGINVDYNKAFEKINRAADLGHLGAIYDIGVFYHDGKGTNIDFKKSKVYLDIAARSGLKKAEQKLIDWKQDFSNIKIK